MNLMNQRHQKRVKPWMVLVGGFSLVKLMGAFVPPPQVKDMKIMSTWFLTPVVMRLCVRKGQFDVSCFRLADGYVIWRRFQ